MIDRLRRQTGYVYFLQSDTHELVKIGVTKNVNTRFSSIQVGCPCPLVLAGVVTKATWNEAQALEQRLHRQFAEHRVKGEWFKLDSNTIAEIIEHENKNTAIEEEANSLAVEKRIEQEAEWKEDGFQAYHDGVSVKDFPSIGIRYSNPWRRARDAWRSGWQEARAGQGPKTERRTWLSR